MKQTHLFALVITTFIMASCEKLAIGQLEKPTKYHAGIQEQGQHVKPAYSPEEVEAGIKVNGKQPSTKLAEQLLTAATPEDSVRIFSEQTPGTERMNGLALALNLCLK